MDLQYLKSVLKYALSAFLSLVLIAYILYHISGGFEPEIETTPASLVTSEMTMTVGVTILRDETIVYSPVDGEISYLFGDGQKVAINTPIADIYPGGTSTELRQQIIALDKQIRLLENSNMSDAEKRTDTASTDKQIEKQLNQLFDKVADGHISDAAAFADQLLIQLNRRRIITHAVVSYNEKIAALKEQREALAAQLSAAETSVLAGSVGYFYTAIDGYEQIFSAEGIAGIDYRDYLALAKQSPEDFGGTAAGYPIGKLVTDYLWYIACEVDAELLHNYQTDKTYRVKFPYNNDTTLTMTLYRILSEVGADTVVLIFRSDILPSDFNYLRNQTVQIVQSSYTGYRVPVSAVRIVNGQTGVYILRGSTVQFRRITPLCEADGYLIVAERDTSTDNYGDFLAKNDFIITKGKDLYDGKVVH
ncbi:MAG: hypothetical protein E7618_07920 [Ruminococcaceae bacterium]|nr:hypothetical protein [Oscillospiraceae bacterium]